MKKYTIEVTKKIIIGNYTEYFSIEASSFEEALEKFNEIGKEDLQNRYDYHLDTYYEIEESEELSIKIS